MDIGLHTFAVSGVTTWLWFPPLVALLVSFFTSMCGLSGAFLLLPFQMSMLGFVTPAVSATNLVFNLIATPGGVYRYYREGRMLWPLVWVILLATAPGVLIGFWVRVTWLRDPGKFMFFVSAVLLYLGLKLLRDNWRSRNQGTPSVRGAKLEKVEWSRRGVVFRFGGETYGFGFVPMGILATMVGVIGGIYGVGGGALIAPFCIALFRLPIHAIAGATLAGALITSVVGVVIYSALPAPGGIPTGPDWALGLLFGMGGFVGMYLGARCQKFVPQRALTLVMGFLLTGLAAHYGLFGR